MKYCQRFFVFLCFCGIFFSWNHITVNNSQALNLHEPAEIISAINYNTEMQSAQSAEANSPVKKDSITRLRQQNNSQKVQSNPRPQINEKVLFAFGIDNLKKGDFKKALFYFEHIEDKFSYTSVYQVSQVMSAYTYFLLGSFKASNVIIDDLLSLYPDNLYREFLYYLRINNYYYGFTNKSLDIEALHQGINTVDVLCNQFTGHKYCAASKKRAVIMRNLLIYYDLEQMSHYLSKSQEPLAALASYINIYNKYKDWPDLRVMPEVLFRLVSWYAYFGWFDESMYWLQELRDNYAETYWSRHASLWLESEILQGQTSVLSFQEYSTYRKSHALLNYCQYLKKQDSKNTKQAVNDTAKSKQSAQDNKIPSSLLSIGFTTSELQDLTIKDCFDRHARLMKDLSNFKDQKQVFQLKINKWNIKNNINSGQVPDNLSNLSCQELLAEFDVMPPHCDSPKNKRRKVLKSSKK